MRPPPRFTYPAIAAATALAISAVRLPTPSFWSDEAATVSGSTRTVGELWELVHSLDAVHGVYYTIMGRWFELVPATEGWARIPGLLAVSATAAALVVLVSGFAGRRIGLIAGLLFGLIPQVTWAAIEVRSYSFTMLLAACLGLSFVGAVRSGSRIRWLGYAVLIVVGCLLFVYTVLLVPVHAIMLAAMGTERRTRIRFLCSAGPAVLISAPFVWFVSTQSGQVGWISDLGFPTPIRVARQYADNSSLFVVAAAILVSAAVVVGHEPLRRWSANPYRQLWIFAVAWMAVPTAAILLYSAVSDPIYLDKYLSFTAPGLAIVLALSIHNLTRSVVGVGVCIGLVVASAAPIYLHQRTEHAKLGMDFSDVAALLDAQARPGDCLLLDDTVTWKPGPIRAMTASRPDVFDAMVDVGLGKRGSATGKMWDQNLPPDRVREQIAACEVIWTVSQKDPTLTDRESGIALPPGPQFARHPAFFVPAALGFRLIERWQFNQSQVIKAVRV
ncbi:glycosyltransferase family 39 protein [Williamsia sp. 1135]|uniref:glycosyltransferase family 39 protein n=1 Tax=Williamsia sp. 1135 TaxID=1889262 RepID=UPI000A0FF4DF|nr:glycosyltransferase family 39 protein [Williamsia sp. 1135]ORM35164.1 hypothetical protein BFL43_10215 [Williamsia sp. 1135]